MAGADAAGLVEDVFRRESAHLVAALTRLLGTSNLPLAEDVVHEALLRAMQAWRLELPRDPKAWLLTTARNLAIDRIRRDRRLVALLPGAASDRGLEGSLEAALSSAEDAANQLALMFSICDDALSRETHVTLILRFLCGLSPAEIAGAFLVDTPTIDRRLHRGRARLRELGHLADVGNPDDVRVRQPSVMQTLYLLFSEGYHGSDATLPLHPAMCTDAIRLAELLLELPAASHSDAHALAALFCFDAARLPGRLDDAGVLLPLSKQDRTRWDRALVERGVVHLARSATGDEMTRWHLEAGIACEHAIAPSLEATNWRRIVELYDWLHDLAPGPIVALNRALAVAELHGAAAGLEALSGVEEDARVARYPFFWGALADLERRAGRHAEARSHYERAGALARSDAERLAYARERSRLDD